MDRLANNWTHDINATISTSAEGQDCAPNSTCPSFLDKLLVTAPSLVSVNQDLRWIFLLHTYGFACLFFVLGSYTVLSILHLRSLISRRPFMTTINGFLCLLGGSRAACLCIDPYNLRERMPKVMGSIMWDIGFPCVTSAFCLIQLAFLQLTQLKFGPEKLQRETCLSLIITGNFVFVIASDVVLIFHNCYMAKYVVQTVFLVWSVLLYLTFLHAGYKIMHLLRTMPSSMFMRENSNTHQKGIMQLAMLAPYSNLMPSFTAALVPTLISPKIKDSDEAEPATFVKDSEKIAKDSVGRSTKESKKEEKIEKEPENVIPCKTRPVREERKPLPVVSTVPEVYVRPPTPTPSTANLPIITVSSPSRRSSIASRRGSDASRSSRRNSECSVRFINEADTSIPEYKRGIDFSPRHSPEIDRKRSPDRMSRRHSENVTPLGSTKDLRRCSDFSHEKNRSSQFATKLRRNSDFGNRTPRRMLPSEDHHRLPRVLDLSPTGSRRNSDVGSFTPSRSESRRNSDISYRRHSEFVQVKPLTIHNHNTDMSIRTLDKSPTHYQSIVSEKTEIQEKSESDSEQPDCSEKAALMTEKGKDRDDDGKARKKNLSWQNDKKGDNEDITAATNLLPENTGTDGAVVANDFTLHSILNHIAYVNRTKTDTPLHILEANTAAARRSQIRGVLNVTYATAIFGIILCIADIARVFGPYGLLAETVKYGTRPAVAQYPKPWPWLLYQTLCRGLELIMGYAMASIAKQPSVSPRHQYLSGYPNYSPRIKRGNNPYI